MGYEIILLFDVGLGLLEHEVYNTKTKEDINYREHVPGKRYTETNIREACYMDWMKAILLSIFAKILILDN
ncbi:MAG: hypothetical protein NC347_08835 [Clostridium sp.]|nr:hypothetical protein [Clostridium sp.]